MMLIKLEILRIGEGSVEGMAVEEDGDIVTWYAVKRSDGAISVTAWCRDKKILYEDEIGLEHIKKAASTVLD